MANPWRAVAEIVSTHIYAWRHIQYRYQLHDTTLLLERITFHTG